MGTLTDIGIDPLEENLYLTLLKQPGQTRNELALSLPNISRAKLVSAIDGLQAQGMITALAGRPIRYAPIAPDVAVAALAQQRVHDARTAQQRIPELMELFWAAPRGTGVDFIEIVAGSVESVIQRNRQLSSAAQESIRAFERPPFAVRTFDEDVSVEKESFARGVAFMVIYDQAQIDDPERWMGDIRWSLGNGEQARVLPTLPLKMVLYDDVAARAPLVDSRGEYLGSLVIHQSPLLEALSALFDAYWERAVPLTPNHDAANGEGRDHDEELVALLAAGLTDDAIARTLGISRSTVLRRVKDLMIQTGSRSRFQVGLQIGRMSPASRRG